MIVKKTFLEDCLLAIVILAMLVGSVILLTGCSWANQADTAVTDCVLEHPDGTRLECGTKKREQNGEVKILNPTPVGPP